MKLNENILKRTRYIGVSIENMGSKEGRDTGGRIDNIHQEFCLIGVLSKPFEYFVEIERSKVDPSKTEITKPETGFLDIKVLHRVIKTTATRRLLLRPLKNDLPSILFHSTI